MQRSTKSELQMLREVSWLLCPRLMCEFCHRPLLVRPQGMTFGHRRHPSVSIKLSTHHRDRNRENNFDENLGLVHRKCHEAYHASQRERRSE